MTKTTFRMKNTSKIFFICCALFFSAPIFAQYQLDPNYEPIKITEPFCTYPIKAVSTYEKVPAVQSAIASIRRGDTPCSTFIVDYNGFSPEAEAAFQFAVDIWSYTIESSIPISVEATFETNANPNNLGSARSDGVYALMAGPGEPTYWYPSALAEKLSDEELTTDPFPFPGPTNDIIANFNDTQPWYFGLDANPPGNQFDFVTVVLHELGHGLGFSGIFGKTIDTDDDDIDDQGRIRVQGTSPVWDSFIENGTGDAMLSFADPSAALLAEFTGNDLFSNSPLATTANGGTLPKIFAPGSFQGGSSYSHWDTATFPASNENSLMTPTAGAGEANHNPGPITIGFRRHGLDLMCFIKC